MSLASCTNKSKAQNTINFSKRREYFQLIHQRLVTVIYNCDVNCAEIVGVLNVNGYIIQIYITNCLNSQVKWSLKNISFWGYSHLIMNEIWILKLYLELRMTLMLWFDFLSFFWGNLKKALKRTLKCMPNVCIGNSNFTRLVLHHTQGNILFQLYYILITYTKGFKSIMLQ